MKHRSHKSCHFNCASCSSVAPTHPQCDATMPTVSKSFLSTLRDTAPLRSNSLPFPAPDNPESAFCLCEFAHSLNHITGFALCGGLFPLVQCSQSSSWSRCQKSPFLRTNDTYYTDKPCFVYLSIVKIPSLRKHKWCLPLPPEVPTTNQSTIPPKFNLENNWIYWLTYRTRMRDYLHNCGGPHSSDIGKSHCWHLPFYGKLTFPSIHALVLRDSKTPRSHAIRAELRVNGWQDWLESQVKGFSDPPHSPFL